MALSLNYHHKLYHSDTITEYDLARIKQQLDKNILLSDVYLIIPAINQQDQLEFFHSRQLAQPYYRQHSMTVIGIARSYTEAVDMIQRIVQECLDARGDCLLREYLSC